MFPPVETLIHVSGECVLSGDREVEGEHGGGLQAMSRDDPGQPPTPATGG